MSPTDVRSDVNALALRLLAFVLLAGGAIAAAMAWTIAQFARITRHGVVLYVLPGTGERSLIDPTAVIVLGAAGLVMLALGLLGLLLARRPVSVGLTRSVARRQAPRTRRALTTLLIGLAVLASVLGFRWTRGAGSQEQPLPRVESPRP